MKKLFLSVMPLLMCVSLISCGTGSETETTTATTAATTAAVTTAAPVATAPTETSAPPSGAITNDTVVLYVGDEPVTYSEFNFHVVAQVNSYQQSEEGITGGFDPNMPMSEQYYPGSEITLEEMFRENTLSELHNTIAMYCESRNAGYKMGEWESENINTFFESLRTFVAGQSITEEMAFRNKYGIDMTHDEVNAILERNLTGMAYESTLREAMTYTDAELETFYNANKGTTNLPDVNAVSLRIIHFSNRQMAYDVQGKFEATDKSEEAFVELVKTYSTEPEDVELGGLYMDLTPQNMTVESFDDVESWIFDPARKPGDYNVIEMSGAYELVYFASKGDPLWKVWSRYSKQDQDIGAIVGKYPITFPEGSEITAAFGTN